jgi:hypothetical protein
VTELLVNGTAPARSLASFGRFQWLDEDERNDLYNVYSMVSIELQAEIHTERPGYLHILPANGAGSSAATYRQVESQESSTSIGAWERWKKRVPSFVDLAELQEEDLEFAVPHHDRLWVTGFSLAGRQGLVKYVDATAEDCRISSVNKRTAQAMLWPNEVHPVPANLLRTICDAASSIGSNGSTAPGTTDDARSSATSSRNEPYQDALLVCDGFLVPGKDRGGIYVVKNPGNPQTEWTVSLTAATATATATHGANKDDRWFYHRAAWVDLTGDGRQSILTARARVSTRLSRSGSNNNSNTTSANNAGVTTGITKTGELVWLEMPKPHSIDRRTGTPLESDGTIFDPFSARHIPWKIRVLDKGPDGALYLICLFSYWESGHCVYLTCPRHLSVLLLSLFAVMFSVADLDKDDDSIEVISSQFFGKRVTLHSIQKGPRPRVVFERIIDNRCGSAFGSILADLGGCADSSGQQHSRCVIDSGSTVGSIKTGDTFSHVLVTSHECSYADRVEETDSSRNEHEVKAGAVSSDGGSLFAYRVPEGKSAWKTDPWIRTTVATGFKVHGQLGNMINPGAPGFVYTFHAKKQDIGSNKQPMIAVAGDCAESAFIFRPESLSRDQRTETNIVDASTRYKLMMEIQCGATVGSIGVGYDDFLAEEESGYAKLYIPCYEKDKVLVFSLGSGEMDLDDGW